MNPYKARNQAWINEIATDFGITYTDIARRAGIDPATLTRFMNNPKYKPNLSDTTIQKIAEVMRRSVPAPPTTTPLPRNLTLPTVKVIGTAAAGLWKDVSIITDDHGHEEIPVVENSRYSGHEQYSLLVEGNSVNRIILDGEYAICVEWAGLGIEPKSGQIVHVERSRGGLQEVTIKKVLVTDTGIELWPDSNDPRFQAPIDLAHTDEDTEVTIRGLVIGKFSQFS